MPKSLLESLWITTEIDQDKKQATARTASNQVRRVAKPKATLAELKDLITKLEQIDENLKCSEKDRQEVKKELRHNKNENLDTYFVLARATEEELQQMVDKVETTDKEREKHIKKNMEELKKRYEAINDKLGIWRRKYTQ